MKKNVLFVVDERRMGGVSILLEDILNNINLDKYNIDVMVLHNNGDYLEHLPEGVNVLYGSKYFSGIDLTLKEALKTFNIKTIYHKLKVVFDMKTGLIEKSIKRERKKILRKKYDTEIAFKDGFTALFTIFGDSKRKIHWLNYEYKGINPNAKYDRLFKRILPQFDNIVAVSDGVKNAFSDIYDVKNIDIIENYIDINKIKKKSMEQGLKVNEDDLNFICVGRLHYTKGFDRLVNAIASIKEDGLLPSNFKLRIYGDGPMYDELSNMISENKLDNNVYLMGRTSNPYKEVKNAKLFILSSNFEAFGLVVIEAMSLGVPVMATKTAAVDKLIKNDENGLIVDNSTEGLKDGLLYLLNDLSIIDKYHKNLAKYKYDGKKIIDKIERELDK